MIIQPDPSTVLPQGADPTNAMTASNPDFLSTLQSTMMNQSGMISSANTGLEQAIQGAINKVADSTSKGSQVIESKYNREIDYTNTSQQNALTAVRERGAGISTGDIAYKALASEADKNLKDLEQRKNELIMQNDAAGASKIADLMLTTQKMKIDAMQQTFQNLMSMGNFGLQAQANKRAETAQNFAEKSAIASVGLQYGVPVTEKDTIASITAKAAPFASKKQAAELAQLVANTNLANANAAKAAREGKVQGNLSDPTTEKAYIAMALNQPDVFNDLMSKDARLVPIRTKAIATQVSFINKFVAENADKDYATIKASIEANQSLGANLDPMTTDKALVEAYNAYAPPFTAEKLKKQKEAEAKVKAMYQ